MYDQTHYQVVPFIYRELRVHDVIPLLETTHDEFSAVIIQVGFSDLMQDNRTGAFVFYYLQRIVEWIRRHRRPMRMAYVLLPLKKLQSRASAVRAREVLGYKLPILYDVRLISVDTKSATVPYTPSEAVKLKRAIGQFVRHICDTATASVNPPTEPEPEPETEPEPEPE